MQKSTSPLKANNKIPTSLTVGTVELNVKNLVIMKEFYQSVLRLKILYESKKKISFGSDNSSLVVLHDTSDLPESNPSHAGLYHFAILFSSQSDLASTILHVLKSRPELFSGSADHLVSEAFYFSDPEGNGIELYYDRDHSQWQWEEGQVKMATLYLDPVAYIEEHTVKKESGKITMGHIHLRVGDVKKAEQFYVEILGFDITAKLPGALFISVGGYHHHIGLNSWESQGAQKRLDSLGLKSIEFFFPHQKDLLIIKERLRRSKIEFREQDNFLILHDPWNNELLLKAIKE